MKYTTKFIAILLAAAGMLTACSSDEPGNGSGLRLPSKGLFVVNEGTYATPSASLTFYNPADATVTNEVFATANGVGLGDAAQSMTVVNGEGWICVSNSGIVYAINLTTGQETGRIEGIASPRYVCQVAPDKVYISQMYSNKIAVVNPRTRKVTADITVPCMKLEPQFLGGSTEEMVKVGNYVYCNCWSYQRDLIKIDTRTDEVVASIDMGVQPKSLAYDGSGHLWVLVDGGGWSGNPAGYESPALVSVNLDSFTIDNSFTLADGQVSHLNYHAGNLYWLQGGIQRMNTTATALPSSAFIPSDSWSLYSLFVAPTGDIYVSDAIDYTQSGTVTRYDSNGAELATFTAGICPSGFCWVE